MPRLRVFRLVPFVAAVASTLLFGGQGGQEAGNTGSVRGTVKNAVTGEVIRKAALSLRGASSSTRESRETAVSDAEGRFTFERLPYGQYSVSAVRDLFSTAGPGPILLDVAGSGQAVEIKLNPTAILTGRIFDEDGEPARGVRVSLVQSVYRDGAKRLEPSRSATTNDLGEYRVWGIRPGVYYVRVGDGSEVQIRRRGFGRTNPNSVYPHLFYPGVIDVAQAQPFEINPGEHRTGVDLRREPTTAVAVRGRVAAPADTNWNNVYISFNPAGPRDGSSSSGLSAPEFEFAGVLPGEYVVELHESAGRNGEELFGRRRVTVGDVDVDDVTVELRPAITLKGRVAIEGESLPQGARAELRVQLLPEYHILSGPFGFEAGIEGGLVGLDGQFECPGLAPARYKLDIPAAHALGYLKKVRSGRNTRQSRVQR